jgi:hypothetical protein|tara:strand:- start:32 stop:235 length:204 start_codon:yes stop_codon:yes gene_type:complete
VRIIKVGVPESMAHQERSNTRDSQFKNKRYSLHVEDFLSPEIPNAYQESVIDGEVCKQASNKKTTPK